MGNILFQNERRWSAPLWILHPHLRFTLAILCRQEQCRWKKIFFLFKIYNKFIIKRIINCSIFLSVRNVQWALIIYILPSLAVGWSSLLRTKLENENGLTLSDSKLSPSAILNFCKNLICLRICFGQTVLFTPKHEIEFFFWFGTLRCRSLAREPAFCFE